MAVPVDARGDTWTMHNPARSSSGGLTRTTTPLAPGPTRALDKRFFVVKEQPPDSEATAPQIIVVQNWFEELKRLVPPTR